MLYWNFSKIKTAAYRFIMFCFIGSAVGFVTIVQYILGDLPYLFQCCPAVCSSTLKLCNKREKCLCWRYWTPTIQHHHRTIQYQHRTIQHQHRTIQNQQTKYNWLQTVPIFLGTVLGANSGRILNVSRLFGGAIGKQAGGRGGGVTESTVQCSKKHSGTWLDFLDCSPRVRFVLVCS